MDKKKWFETISNEKGIENMKNYNNVPQSNESDLALLKMLKDENLLLMLQNENMALASGNREKK